MSGCREYRDDLSAHLDGALGPEARSALEAHLAQCPDCRRALEDLRATVARIRSLEPVEPPPWLEAKILARVGRPAPRGQRLLLLALRPQVQAAALALICFTGFLVLKVAGPRRALVPPALQPAPPAVEQEAAPEPVRKKAAPRPEPPAHVEAPADKGPAPAQRESLQPPAPQPPPPPDTARKKEAAPAARAEDMAAKASQDSNRATLYAAAPPVAFRLEPSGPGAPADAVLEALRLCGGVLLSRGERSLTARLERQRLPELRTALEKAGRVREGAPRDLPPLVVLTISW